MQMLTPDEYAQLPEEEKYPPHIAGSIGVTMRQEQEELDMKRGWCWWFGPRQSIRHPGPPLPLDAADDASID
jgi:hypothetical protein